MKTIQRTLAIIKPDAVEKNAVGDIVNTILAKGFRIIGMKMLNITKAQADGFYAGHAGKPFFQSLVNFMARGPIVVLALEKDNAIADWRELMGVTNPANAAEGTIRKKWGGKNEKHGAHGSGGKGPATFRILFFFAGYELAK